jgi:ligand-binding sensor protein
LGDLGSILGQAKLLCRDPHNTTTFHVKTRWVNSYLDKDVEFDNSPVTEKSEAIAPCKEMLVILVNKVVDKKTIIGKRGPRKKKGTRGC